MIVITGGAGFIGSNIAAVLDEAGADIAIVDRLRSNDKWRNLAKRVLRAVVEPPALWPFLERAGESVEAVVHMGAISSTTQSDGDLVVQTNFELSRALWQWCTEHRCPFIYASSAATYGGGEEGFVDDADPAALRQLRPLNLYGWSKHLFDQYVARVIENGEPTPPQHVGLKFFNVYGPNEAHKGSMRSVIAHLFPRVREGEPAKLFRSYDSRYDDGGQLRDFVYVADCANIVRWLLDSPSTCGLFNVGTGKARSFADLANATMAAVDRPAAIEYIDMPEGLRAKYQYFTQANIDKLRAAGYNAPMTELEAGVEDYVGNFLATEDPYR